MKTNTLIAPLSLVLALALSNSASAADATAPNADQLLRQMSAKLAAARSFTFEAAREIDPALLEGRDVPEKARVAVSVQRPNKIAARATSKLGTRRVVFDGRTFSLLDAKPNHYATVLMRTSIDGLVERLDEQYGFVPPLAEFALSDPYADLRRQAHTVTYLGRAKTSEGFLGLGGVECHRIGLKGKAADAELWIAAGDLLPRKLIATFHRAGQPQVRIAFSSWNLAAPVSAADFTFTPPAGAQKIEMWTTAKMQAARKP
jgi:hypothetical protein